MSPIFQHRAHGTGEYSSQSGFNIIELMVVMAIVTIMATVAIPSFMTMSRDSRLAVKHNDFIGTLNLARNEALTRGARVTICKSATGTTCNNDPLKGWEIGWIVFLDTGGLAGVGVVDAISDTVIRIFPPLKEPNTLRGNGTVVNRITFTAQGMIPNTVGILTFCDPRGDSHARGLILARSAQAKVAKDSDNNGIADNGRNPPVDLVCPA